MIIMMIYDNDDRDGELQREFASSSLLAFISS